jgi:predicted RNA polymerase sigma factor
LLITHGLAALDRAEDAGGTGSYAIRAKIAACHARVPRAEDTDWVRIALLYRDPVALIRSPIVELNRAVAVSMADGPAAGLAVTDGLLDVSALRTTTCYRACADTPRSTGVSKPVESVEDQVEAELELVAVVVAGLEDMLDRELREVWVFLR